MPKVHVYLHRSFLPIATEKWLRYGAPRYAVTCLAIAATLVTVVTDALANIVYAVEGRPENGLVI